jgi:hypothetical protein
MPGPLDQLPPDAKTLATRVAKLERLVRELLAAKRASNADIGGGDTSITGARIQTAADGARAVLADGALQIYDDSDNLTNNVGGPNNIIFNQSGWPIGEYVAMYLGNLLLGLGNGLSADLSQAGLIGVLGAGDAMLAQSPKAGTNTDVTALIFRSGDPAAAIGAATRRHLEADADQWITGAITKAAVSGGTMSQETWQTPTWGANWSGTNTLGSMGGFRTLQAHRMTQDDVWVLGAATTTGTSGTIGTLPANMWPPTGARVLLDATFFKSGTVTLGKVQITEAGVINSSLSLGGVAITSGTQVFINDSYPLGNTP